VSRGLPSGGHALLVKKNAPLSSRLRVTGEPICCAKKRGCCHWLRASAAPVRFLRRCLIAQPNLPSTEDGPGTDTAPYTADPSQQDQAPCPASGRHAGLEQSGLRARHLVRSVRPTAARHWPTRERPQDRTLYAQVINDSSSCDSGRGHLERGTRGRSGQDRERVSRRHGTVCLDHTYTILDRFETDRVLLSLATAVVADIAEWVFLMHTLGSRYSPDAILLHGGAVSRRILGRVASDWHARSQLEQARRRIRAVSPSQLFLQAPVRLTPPSRVNSGQSVAALPMSNVSAGTSSTSLSLPPSKHRNIQIIRNIQLAQGNLVLGIATARSHRARSQVLGTFSGRRR
jgi:hypothetical protein